MMVKKDFDILLIEEKFREIELVINSASNVGITKIINVGTSLVESINSVEIAKRFSNVFASVGIHPCDAKDDWKKDFEKIKHLSKENKVVAIGETGLDFYHKPFNKQRQIDCFRAHIELALKQSMPIIIHIREAVYETLQVLEQYASELQGVNHCFQPQKDIAEQFIKWGFYLGIDAPITYPKNEYFRELLKDLPLESLVLETDAPFLPPVEFRGKPNHPKYIPLFAQIIAKIKSISLEKVAEITTQNASKLFFIK